MKQLCDVRFMSALGTSTAANGKTRDAVREAQTLGVNKVLTAGACRSMQAALTC